MSYRLNSEEEFVDGIRRIAYEQINDALNHLTQPNEDRDEAIHEARKCFKKVRATLRLVRDNIGESVFKRENVCFRDAGRLLSLVRDSAVMIKTLDGLTEKYDDSLAADAFAQARQVLVATHEPLLEDVFAPDQAVSEVIDMVQAGRERVATWPLEVEDFDDIAPSLRRVYKRGYKRRLVAYDAPTPERFHEWRKRVKYLWYHLRILRPMWPDLLKTLADEVHDLSDYLGDDHDLAELRAWAEKRPSLFNSAASLTVLQGLIDQERACLQAKAAPLGQRLYAEEPDHFVERLGHYWHAWQS